MPWSEILASIPSSTHDKRMKLKWPCFYKKFVLKHFTRKCKNARFGAKFAKITLPLVFQRLYARCFWGNFDFSACFQGAKMFMRLSCPSLDTIL